MKAGMDIVIGGGMKELTNTKFGLLRQ